MKFFRFIFFNTAVGLSVISCDTDEDLTDDDQENTTLPEGTEEGGDYLWNTSDETLITFKGSSINIKGICYHP